MIAGSFALGGVLVAQITTIAVERTRARREDSTRWQADRRQVYASFATAAIFIFSLVQKRWSDGPDWPEWEERLRDFELKHQEVLLIGSEPVRDTSEDFYDAIEAVPAAMAAGDLQDEIVARVNSAGDVFIEAARRELRVEAR